MGELHHLPVMINEVTELLVCQPDRIYVDCTLGEGGHAIEILKKSSPTGRLIGIDCDLGAIEIAKRRLEPFQERVNFIHENFINLRTVLEGLKIKEIDGIFFDLGVSSYQLDSKERGFSFQLESPLDMRFDQRVNFSAYEVVNKFSTTKIEEILRKYGEERWAKKIARVIDKRRKNRPISTTTELARIIKSAVPESYCSGRIHPATRTFQAIRIAVNDELNNLERGINDGINFLKRGGRFCIISFHSLEDRIVKRFFRDLEKEGVPSVSARFKVLTKKPISPQSSEVVMNPRARSSKLRAIERVRDS